jgi:deoxyribose-phosphate aldolase
MSHERNPGIPLDQGWVQSSRVNRSAAERRAATHGKRRSIKKDWQAAWLLKAITCIDLTTLSGDDTPSNVHRLCAKARQPVRQDILDDLGVGEKKITVAAVCVYHRWVRDAVQALQGTDIPVAAVSTGFPAGLSPYEQRVAEIEQSVEAGAKEIDTVITREHVLRNNWQALYDEVKQFRETCGEAHLKTILATGELGTLTNVKKASLVCMMAGADFIKTSTGKEKVNATLPVGFVMTRAIREYQQKTGHQVGFKPAGGISKAKDALNWLALIKEELGDEWLNPGMFRFGASSLLADIERQLSHHVTGRYAARHHMPMG